TCIQQRPNNHAGARGNCRLPINHTLDCSAWNNAQMESRIPVRYHNPRGLQLAGATDTDISAQPSGSTSSERGRAGKATRTDSSCLDTRTDFTSRLSPI